MPASMYYQHMPSCMQWLAVLGVVHSVIFVPLHIVNMEQNAIVAFPNAAESRSASWVKDWKNNLQSWVSPGWLGIVTVSLRIVVCSKSSSVSIALHSHTSQAFGYTDSIVIEYCAETHNYWDLATDLCSHSVHRDKYPRSITKITVRSMLVWLHHDWDLEAWAS